MDTESGMAQAALRSVVGDTTEAERNTTVDGAANLTAYDWVNRAIATLREADDGDDSIIGDVLDDLMRARRRMVAARAHYEEPAMTTDYQVGEALADALGAVRELVAKWRAMAPLCKTPGYGEAMRENADVLEAALAQAPAMRVDDVLLRVSDEDLRWCKDIVGTLQEAGGPTDKMRAVGLSRLIAALEAALGQGKAS